MNSSRSLSFLFITIVALAALRISAASPVSETRIVGGEAAQAGQFPYQVSLRNVAGRHFCGGSILTDRWVITACHCTVDSSAENIKIAVGTIDITSGPIYDVEELFNHEAYNGYVIRNDVSMLKTATPIEFSDLIQPIAIRTNYVDGAQTAIASGWGMTSYPGSVPQMLQFITLKTLTNRDCRLKQPNSSLLYDGSLCTLTKSKEGMCMGDSGGPLVVDGQLVGLVSWGTPCARGYPDVFTRVSEFNDWIADKMAKH